MKNRALFRLGDMREALTRISELLSGKSYEEFSANPDIRAAFERYLEILSEASRHIPEDWKSERPQIEWRKIADMGNHLRHAYHRTDQELLWNIHVHELAPLRAAVNAMIELKGKQ